MLPFLFTFFIAVGLSFRLFLMAKVPFYDWDEAIYAQVAKELIKNKNLLTTYNQNLWIEKPPLPAFLYGLVVNFKPAEFWLRTITLTGGFIFLFLLYLLSKKIINSFFLSDLKKRRANFRQIIYLLPVMIVLSSSIIIDRMLMVNTDLWLTIGWVGFFLFSGNFMFELFFLLVGVLSKSLLGFYSLLVLLPVTEKKLKSFIKVIGLFVISSLWYLFFYIKLGQTFIQYHFFDHLLKRVVNPIELHFGNKFYYLSVLYKEFSFILLIFIFSYILIGLDFIKKLLADRFSVFSKAYLKNYLIFFSVPPLLIFLTLAKTKISWYLTPLIPLSALVVPYFIMRIKSNIIQYLLISSLLIFFLINFISNTFLFKLPLEIPEKVQLAKCISRLSGNEVDFLVDDQERKNGNFLEASKLYINSSFIYGGSSSFLYYSQKHVNYFYNIDKFISRNLNKIAVVQKSDFDITDVFKNSSFSKSPCSTKNFFVIIKN